jgi:putative tricarboxylic transport membrane protein
MRRMRSRRRTTTAALVSLVLAAALSACGVTRGDDSRDILMIIPNSPGGGYNLTGRDAVQVMEDQDITGGSITVENIVGAGGAVAMTELVGKVGDEHTLMTVGLGVGRQLRDLRRRGPAHQRAARQEDRRGLLRPARVPGLHRLR